MPRNDDRSQPLFFTEEDLATQDDDRLAVLAAMKASHDDHLRRQKITEELGHEPEDWECW